MDKKVDNRQISPALWGEYNHRTTSRWQRFREGFEVFDQKVENFFMWYWPHLIFVSGVCAMLWVAVFITRQPNGWYHVGRSIGETFLGW
ncbi:MAG: hypothetical protein ACK42D_00980 [Candidatus Paceibacteria bacterium]